MTVCTMMLGLVLTLAQALPVIILGVALCTLGFFGGHSVASSWVGRRALRARALASLIEHHEPVDTTPVPVYP